MRETDCPHRKRLIIRVTWIKGLQTEVRARSTTSSVLRPAGLRRPASHLAEQIVHLGAVPFWERKERKEGKEGKEGNEGKERKERTEGKEGKDIAVRKEFVAEGTREGISRRPVPYMSLTSFRSASTASTSSSFSPSIPSSTCITYGARGTAYDTYA